MRKSKFQASCDEHKSPEGAVKDSYVDRKEDPSDSSDSSDSSDEDVEEEGGETRSFYLGDKTRFLTKEGYMVLSHLIEGKVPRLI